MAGAPDMWMIDFGPHSPQYTALAARKFTVFKVPEHLQGGSFDYDYNFRIEMLQLGLHNRTLTPNTPEKVFQNLKLEIASVLHHKLLTLVINPPATPAPPATPTPPATPAPLPPVSTIRSWDDFAKAVVGDADIARRNFEKPTPMSDVAVQNHLALDALFIVFYFQYLNANLFNIIEFKDLAQRRSTTLRSLGLSDFLLLENQVPMYLLQNVVQELCKIDDDVSGKISESNWKHLVEDELQSILLVAVLSLNPISEPTIVHGTPDACALTTIFKMFVQWMRMIASSINQVCMLRVRGRQKETKLTFHDEMFLGYLEFHYPRYCPHALKNCEHILDCVYRVVCGHVVPPYKWDEKQLENPFLESIPNATQLEEVGIKAERSTNCTGNSVELSHGCHTWICSARLKLPKLEILDETARKFRNLAIYEQLRGQDRTQYNSDMRCYLVCMSELCTDAADLQLLSKKGVINVHKRHESALNMWDKILKDVERPIPSNAWQKCYNNVHNHRHTRWKRFRRKHFGIFFSQPWATISLLAAVVLLFLTALQTWFTVVNSVSSKERWPKRN